MVTSATSTAPSEEPTIGRVSSAAGVAVRLALAGVCLLPEYGLLVGEPSLAGRLAVLGLFTITLLRPGDGLLLCAGLLPLASGPLGFVLHAKPFLREPLLLAFLAGWLLRDSVRPAPPADAATRRVLAPAFILAAVVAASLLVQLSVEQVSVDYPWPYALAVLGRVANGYGIRDGLDAIFPAALVLEGIGLFAATIMISRREAGLGRRVIGMATAGAAGVAAVNVYRCAEILLRHGGSWQASVETLRRVRVSMVFPDFNAAGSFFAMMLVAAAGLAVSARGAARWAWGATALLISLALALTGSRTAEAAVALGGLVALGLLAARAGRLRLRTALVVAAAIALAATAAMMARYDAERGVIEALQIRGELNKAALLAAVEHPVFGVGVGRYWYMSSRYLDVATRDLLRARTGASTLTRENAHNNFLQILADLGLLGAVPLFWLIAVVARGAARAPSSGEGAVAGTLAGMLAFLLTCLAGHPLLIREVSNQFWLVLGVIGAVGLAAPGSRGPSISHPTGRWWWLAAFALCLAASVPPRAQWTLDREADLSRAAIGFPPVWSYDEQGVRYRAMRRRAQFYVGADACIMTLALRLAPGAPVTDVELLVDDQPVARVRADAGSWRQAKVSLMEVPGKRFRKIGLRTVAATDVEVRTGRPVFLICRPGSAPKLDR